MASTQPAADDLAPSASPKTSPSGSPLNEEHGDTDSAYDEGSLNLSTASVPTSVYQYRKEHGRTYHAYKDGQYNFPNDATELDRLDLQHMIFLLTFDGKLHNAPIKNDIHHVLDVGCGTGLWAMDFADAHPETKVLGIDLSPVQDSFVPPNLEFEVDDANEQWLFKNKFDFIFARQHHSAIEETKLIDQAFDNLEPGGWIELQELCLPCVSDDGTLLSDSALLRCFNLLVEASKKIGQPADSPKNYEPAMRKRGFVNVEKHVHKWATNTWPTDPKEKEIGKWTKENLFQGIQGFALALLTRVLGWGEDEVEVLLMDVRNEIKNTEIHAYWPLYVVYGQKPENPTA
ncbi:S-adenosyl-L-methionine-dependent methyltransferase [Eremomyces bilateralis CBS 781.70]|uniref:S-adenosyl-L-methionine-dependent methyltransferase n=1 Tax=Eremomyces bilateralis CBS 781.70 TaxID=1392243 RepID=A0A6G1FWH0_9PEZI|nr:S-adenosyl-L-methionine-dependent methyltransferase [Eremomyces bilateralis CBS 781.70]KAF1810036.1 S-adenosyl-L-methionine-dependent methyltransferase [Eremomyces bilateralis CBS 781.70]